MNTLRFFMVMTVMMCSLAVNAQDVIVKNDGSTITSKVLEITSNEIKYKKFSNQKGPTYSINKEDVNYINYENGERENFGKISTPQPNTEDTHYSQNTFTLQQQNNNQMSDAELLKSIGKDPYTIRLKKANRLKKVGLIGGSMLFAAGTAFILLQVKDDFYGGKYNTEIFSSFGASILWTTSFLIAAHHQKKIALSANTSTPLVQFNLTQSKNSAIYANINMLNDNMTNRKALGLGFNFNF